MALNIDGADDLVDHGDITAFDGVAGLTISYWTNLDTSVAGDVLFRRQATTGVGFRCHVITGNTDMGFNLGASAQQNTGRSVGSIVAGAWQHWLWIFDGSGVGNAARLRGWLNGAAQTLTFTNTIPATVTASASASFETGHATTPIDGRIAHLIIWLTALDSTVALRQQYSRRPVSTTSLRLWLPYDDALAARDYSGNGHHGTVTGALQDAGPPIGYGATVMVA